MKKLLSLISLLAIATIVCAASGVPYTGSVDVTDVDDLSTLTVPHTPRSGMTGTTGKAAIDELYNLIGSSNTGGINWTSIDAFATTTGLDAAYTVWSIDGSTKKMTGENVLDWIAADGGFESHTSNDIDPDRLKGDSVDDDKIDAGLIADLSASYLALGADIVAATGNNAFTIDSDVDSSDTLILRAYDSNQTAYDSMVTLTSGNEPTITIAADGTIGISSGGNTTINGITAATGSSGTVTLGGDFYLIGDILASNGNDSLTISPDNENADTLILRAYDVDGTNWDNVLTITSSNTPTLAIATDGNTTINSATFATGSSGTVTLGGNLYMIGDIYASNGNNAYIIRSDDENADTLELAVYDVDGEAWDSIFIATSGNTPTLTLAADGGITVSNATTLNGSMTVSNGCALDLSGVTMSASTDEGLALPVWADVTPATTAKRWLAWDESGGVMQVYTNGGWQEIGAGGSGGAPTTAGYLITGSLNATLTAERVLTAGEGIDFDDGGVNSTFTINCEDATDSNKGVAYFSSDNFLANSGGITIKDGGVAPAELASTDFGVFTVAAGVASLDADTVNATHIDWGAGANQIDLDDIPDSANYQKVAAADVDSNSHVNLVQDSDGTGAVQFTGITSGTSVKTFSNGNATVVEEGVATGGLLIGDSSPDTGGEIGYASNALSFHDGTASRTVMTIDSAQNVSADKEIQDNVALSFGNDNDWEITYDETTDDRLEFTHTAGAGADVYWDLNDNAADSTYTITNSNGTYEANLIVEGDITCSGAITSNASGDSYLALANNAGGLAPSGYRIYFETDSTDVLSYSVNGSEKRFANLGDAQTFTGIKTFSSDIIFIEEADHASTPSAGYGYLWVKSDTPSSLIFTDDAGTDYDLTAVSSGDVESVGDCTSGAALDGSSDGGSYIRIYDGDSHYGEFQVPDISENVTYTFPAATSTIATLQGSDTQVIFNNGGTAYAGDAGFVFNSTTDTLTLGENGVDGILVLYNESGGTDYNLIMQPGTQSAAATITFPGSTSTLATLGLAETFSGAKTFSAALTLDDGSGASPDFIMKDATDETATFSKVDSGYLTITTAAADGVNVLVGNLKVGDGSPGQTINGEDFYVNGLAEIDGMLYADGGVTAGGIDAGGILFAKTGGLVATNSGLTYNSETQSVTVAGDLTVSGDDITLGTNTAGYILVGDDTNYNPVAVSGMATLSSAGEVTVVDFGLTTGADAGDQDITSINKLEGVDSGVFIDMGADGIVQIASDTTIHLDLSDETLILADGGTNEIDVSTDTNVATIDFNAISLLTSGTIAGRVPMVQKNASGSISAAECRGYVVIMTTTGTLTLPAAATAGYGSAVIVRARDAEVVTIDPYGAEIINIGGKALTAGYAIKSDGSAGSQVSLISVTDTGDGSTDGWLVLGVYPSSDSFVTNGS